MHYIFGGGNDSHCLPEILNEEKFDNLPHVRDLIWIKATLNQRQQYVNEVNDTRDATIIELLVLVPPF